MKKCFAIVLVSLSFTAIAKSKAMGCENAFSTLEINQCASVALGLARAELTKYLNASFEHNADDKVLVESIKVAQNRWKKYTSSHCNSVYTQWRDGTIRDLMAISCKTELTKQRTHQVWANYLTYLDSTPPVLPELKK